MKPVTDESRRRLLKSVTVGVALIPIAGLPLPAHSAADLPLVTTDDPTAKALQYVSDASGCVLFPGKAVKATGWCSSWAAKT